MGIAQLFRKIGILKTQVPLKDRSQYDAFVSYSHAADRKLAPVLHSELHRFAKPWYRRRGMRIFRDETGMAANPALWDSIKTALKKSRFFILLASPKAAVSQWVERELALWLAHRSAKTILIALTDGEIAWSKQDNDIDWTQTTALPRNLAGAFPSEPLWVDLRFAHNSLALSTKNPDFAKAVARLVAAIKERDLDDLIGEDVREHRKFKRWVWSAIVVLVVLTLLSITSAWIASHQRNKAVSRELAATALFRLEFDPEISVQLATKALRQQTTPEAEHVLRQSMAHTRLNMTLFGHTSGVATVAFSSDGERVFTFGWDGSLVIWNSRTGQPISEPATHKGHLRTARVSPDRTRAILLFYPESDRLIDLPSGRLVTVFSKSSTDVLFSSNSKWIATFSSYANVEVLNAHTGTLLRKLPISTLDPKRIKFSPDSNSITVVGKDGLVYTYDISTGRELIAIEDIECKILGVAYSHDGKHIVTGGSNNKITIWNALNGNKLIAFGTGSHEPREVMFNSAGDRIISNNRSEIAIWKAKIGELQCSLSAPGNIAGIVALSPNTETLVVASTSDALVWASRIRDGSMIANLRAHPMQRSSGGTTTVPEVSSVAFSPDGERLATSSLSDNIVRIWYLGDMPQNVVLRGHKLAVSGASFSPNGRWVLTSSWDCTARIWDAKSGKPYRVLRGHTEGIKQASFSLDSRSVLTVCVDYSVRVWNVESGEYLVLGPWKRDVRSAAFSPDSRKIVTAHDAPLVYVCDSTTGQLLLSLPGHGQGAYSAKFSPDGKSVVTGGRDGVIRVWDAQTGQLIQTLKGHTGNVSSLAFNENGEFLLSLSKDKTAWLWDTHTWTRKISYTSRTMLLWGDLSADGRLAVAETFDKRGQGNVMQVWESQTGRFVTTLPGNKEYDRSGAINREGTLIVVPGPNNTAQVWDVAGNKVAAILDGHTESVITTAFSPDGRSVVTASADGTAILYPWAFFLPIDNLKSLVEGITWEKTPDDHLKYMR